MERLLFVCAKRVYCSSESLKPEVMPFTIASLVSFEEDIKKPLSGLCHPVENEQDVKDFLETYRDPSTTHQCWAWKIGHQVRFNDDGEPSGTAGRPILATIEGNELTNVLVLVNRWYGGIKLGTGAWYVPMAAVLDNVCCWQKN